MQVLAVIPARGGSKGIPNKNLQLVANEYLIKYAIDAVLQSNIVNRLFVSSDSKVIREISRKLGAETIVRPHDISGDNSPSEDAVYHCLCKLYEHENYRPDITLMVQCTSPLITPDDVYLTAQYLISEQADCCFTSTIFHKKIWKNYDNWGIFVPVNVEENRMTRQKRYQYIETGGVYAFKTNGFVLHKSRFFGKIVSHVIPEERALEIDTPQDLEIADFLIRKNMREKS